MGFLWHSWWCLCVWQCRLGQSRSCVGPDRQNFALDRPKRVILKQQSLKSGVRGHERGSLIPGQKSDNPRGAPKTVGQR